MRLGRPGALRAACGCEAEPTFTALALPLPLVFVPLAIPCLDPPHAPLCITITHFPPAEMSRKFGVWQARLRLGGRFRSSGRMGRPTETAVLRLPKPLRMCAITCAGSPAGAKSRLRRADAIFFHSIGHVGPFDRRFSRCMQRMRLPRRPGIPRARRALRRMGRYWPHLRRSADKTLQA
jgi:hypothetical protein